MVYIVGKFGKKSITLLCSLSYLSLARYEAMLGKLDKLIIAPLPPTTPCVTSGESLQKGTAYDVISFESEVGVGEEELELEMNMPSNSPSSSTRRPMIQQSDNSLASNVVKFYHDKPGMFVFLVFCVPFILSTIALSANVKMGSCYTCSQSSSDELLQRSKRTSTAALPTPPWWLATIKCVRRWV